MSTLRVRCSPCVPPRSMRRRACGKTAVKQRKSC
jgi:hypothetical protein